MKKDITRKIDSFLSEVITANDYPSPEAYTKYQGHRPIQFMKFWQNYRPGDRVNVNFLDDGIEIFGQNAEGQFAGSKMEKELFIEEPMEIEYFKSAEGDLWNYV